MTASPATGTDLLYAVIKTVSSSLALDRVLGGIVEIATDATDCHACFIYFVEGDRLVLRAASPGYSGLVGKLGWGLDEGLTGWVARTKTPEFSRERALEDPRMKFVPELDEERFQSMVAVPILARDGDVIGVVVLHTEAPREFDDGVLNFLVHTASLVAGAIENAQLYEDARRRVDALTTLTQLSQSLAAVTLREDLYDAVTRGARQLLGADACQIWRLEPDDDELMLAGVDPPDDSAARPGRAALLLDLMRRERRNSGVVAPDDDGLLLAPLVAGDEQLGILSCVVRGRSFGAEDAELLMAVANQTAVGLKKAELIERLTAENIVTHMFDALAAGSVQTRHLERELEREQVLLAQVQSRDALDPVEALAHRIRVDVEVAGAGRNAAARSQEALERLDQLRVAAAVVLDQRVHRLPVAVVGRLVELQVHQVAVGAELLVRDGAAVGRERPPDAGGVRCLAHPPPGAGRTAVDLA